VSQLPFFDKNLLIYSASAESSKSAVARRLLDLGGVVSVQVINESVNVLNKKMKLPMAAAYSVVDTWLPNLSVMPMTLGTLMKARTLQAAHMLSHWDSLVVAAAIEAGCDVLYSEDMAHNQLMGGSVRVVNPFL
jgi:predicted nucleic acid-binding protein